MKLFEYTALIKRSVVIAADSEAEAERLVADQDAAFFEHHGVVVGVSDVDLLETRKMKAKDWRDEAHVCPAKTDSGLPTYEVA